MMQITVSTMNIGTAYTGQLVCPTGSVRQDILTDRGSCSGKHKAQYVHLAKNKMTWLMLLINSDLIDQWPMRYGYNYNPKQTDKICFLLFHIGGIIYSLFIFILILFVYTFYCLSHCLGIILILCSNPSTNDPWGMVATITPNICHLIMFVHDYLLLTHFLWCRYATDMQPIGCFQIWYHKFPMRTWFFTYLTLDLTKSKLAI